MQNWIFTLVINSLVTTLLIMILSGLTLILKSKLAPGVRYFLWVAILFSLLVPVRPIFGQGVVKISSTLLREVVGQAVPVQFLNRHRPMVFGPALTTSHGLS